MSEHDDYSQDNNSLRWLEDFRKDHLVYIPAGSDHLAPPKFGAAALQRLFGKHEAAMSKTWCHESGAKLEPQQVIDGSCSASSSSTTAAHTAPPHYASFVANGGPLLKDITAELDPFSSPSGFGDKRVVKHENRAWVFVGRNPALAVQRDGGDSKSKIEEAIGCKKAAGSAKSPAKKRAKKHSTTGVDAKDDGGQVCVSGVLRGRAEHTDAVEVDGTWHVQCQGSKTWHVRPCVGAAGAPWGPHITTDADADADADVGAGMVPVRRPPSPRTITCHRGDMLVINTRTWFHATEIPPQVDGDSDSIDDSGCSGGGGSSPEKSAHGGGGGLSSSADDGGGMTLSVARDFRWTVVAATKQKKMRQRGTGEGGGGGGDLKEMDDDDEDELDEDDEEVCEATNMDVTYAVRFVAEGEVALKESDLPDCELPRSTNPNCEVAEIVVIVDGKGDGEDDDDDDDEYDEDEDGDEDEFEEEEEEEDCESEEGEERKGDFQGDGSGDADQVDNEDEEEDAEVRSGSRKPKRKRTMLALVALRDIPVGECFTVAPSDDDDSGEQGDEEDSSDEEEGV
jgi:hypothetical protein